MLELKNITKVYPAGGENVQALKGISLRFRKNEFVSILGPSGCGKTTMLNIIGGLDQYTSGDLIINGRSTKEFKDRDWDAYRNHSVGFVFQSYNLIPHQSVLQNVELALTLSGVSKRERRERAREALAKVGLGDQLRKRPGEMSGGQMQRVAIARAIVNDPDIILADEPTGALDTETSVQVMDILKEIARDRLVVMVTHNPELAENYSTRIVRMLDGKILSDSAPLGEEEYLRQQREPSENPAAGKIRKPSMSFATSFGLSLKNLFTKKGRTILTSFAGSIGIIGIALIYAVSHGMTGFIDSVQEQTLSSYPLTIEAQHIDSSSLLSLFMGRAESTSEHEDDAVYQKAMIFQMMNSLQSLDQQENDLKAFKAFIEEQKADRNSTLSEALSAVQYTYNTDFLVYTQNVDGDIIRSDAETLMTELMREFMGMDMSAMLAFRDQASIGGSSAMMDSSSSIWRELLPGDNGRPVSPVFEKQYDVVYGRWPSRYDEVVLFVDQNGELNDMTLYALGLQSKSEIEKFFEAAANHEQIEYETHRWTYEEICAMDFRTVLNADCFTREESGLYTDLRETEAGLKYLYDNGLSLHIVGIVEPGEDAISASERGYVGYTHGLTEYLIQKASESAAVQAQLSDPSTDIFTGLPFRDQNGAMDESQKAEAFREYIKYLSLEEKAAAYIRIKSIPDPALIEKAMEQALSAVSREQLQSQMLEAMAAQTGMSREDLEAYADSMSEEDMENMFRRMMGGQIESQYTAGVQQQLSGMSAAQLVGSLALEMLTYTDEQCAAYYDAVLEFSDSTLEANLVKLGNLDLDSPSTINLYASSFADKDVIEDAIAGYNETVEELQQIQYTDYVGLMMSSVTTIINAITYVLIAFVAVSLIVSSIMIGVITLISVQERTKEIGILRAIGASKKNVASMFNAETVIIGGVSGLIGVIITYLLCIPINMILRHLTGFSNLRASLPLAVAAILVGISMLLTLIAGIIPSRSAAKKDPVVALRTE